MDKNQLLTLVLGGLFLLGMFMPAVIYKRKKVD